MPRPRAPARRARHGRGPGARCGIGPYEARWVNSQILLWSTFVYLNLALASKHVGVSCLFRLLRGRRTSRNFATETAPE